MGITYLSFLVSFVYIFVSFCYTLKRFIQKLRVLVFEMYGFLFHIQPLSYCIHQKNILKSGHVLPGLDDVMYLVHWHRKIVKKINISLFPHFSIIRGFPGFGKKIPCLNLFIFNIFFLDECLSSTFLRFSMIYQLKKLNSFYDSLR